MQFSCQKSVSRIGKDWFITGFRVHFIGMILVNLIWMSFIAFERD